MDKHDARFFAIRSHTLAHEASIASRPPADASRTAQLIAQTFNHHVAVFDHRSAADDPRSPAALALKFYEDHYQPATLHADLAPGKSVSLEQFISEVALRNNSTTGARNQVFYLLGDVGTGKTAFLNYLITKFGYDWVDKGGLWFIRLDIDKLGKGRLPEPDQLLRAMLRQTVRIFRRHGELLKPPPHISLQLDRLEADESKDDTDASRLAGFTLQEALASFISGYNQFTGRSLLLLIDNIDYLYHLNDRTAFFPEANPEDLQAIYCIEDLVQLFEHSGARGSFGDLSANVVISLRKDSYIILRASNRIFDTDRMHNQGRKVYSLVRPDWKIVVGSRGDLLQHAIGQMEKKGQQSVQLRIIEPIMRDLERKGHDGAPSLIEHLQQLTNFGLRDIMRFLADYSWLGSLPHDSEFFGYERLMQSYPVGLLAFLLNGYRKFSQFTSHFPNLYLVVLPEQATTSEALSEAAHPHTYWLKRLLLHYIADASDKKISTKTGDLLSVFSGDRGHLYKERLVRACLGSMAQVKNSNLLAVQKVRSTDERHLQIQDIRITDRAAHCLKHIFDKFLYLQLVVDDHLLPVPKALFSDFAFEEFDAGYSYLCESSADYSVGVQKMIQLKAKQVILFLEILSVTYEIEQQRYPEVFDELNARDIDLPNPKGIKAGIIGELHSLAKKHPHLINIDQLLTIGRVAHDKIQGILRSGYINRTHKTD